MADQVQLGVSLIGADQAIASLTELDRLSKSLNGKNIKITVSSSGITRAANQAEKLNTNLSNASANAEKVGTTASKGMSNAAQSAEKAAKSTQNFSVGLGSIVGNMLKIQAVNAVINGTTRAIKFAFDEMKNVDTEMVNIRKVTGFTADEMERLERSAYTLASKYGRTASEVLQGGTTFARAGYTDQIEQLSELSLLLQNVGDLNAEDASKFLIATDKAYKLGGSYEELMAIIDGLDNITNKNATDMQKMTEGMTVAGSVFAESGEEIEVFAALLGTATAATQRSGSEVGRALRTILMNLRQIRGKTEDGELIDGESIAAASKALKDYAGISTMENGELRKASDILDELAEKWDTLTETQQAAIAEAVAGKRQANVLMALMGDWPSYKKMLGEYQNAAGTAASENAAYMDSWAAKEAQVKAKWTELVSSISDTSLVKNGFDDILGFLGEMEILITRVSSGLDTMYRFGNGELTRFSAPEAVKTATKDFVQNRNLPEYVKTLKEARDALEEQANAYNAILESGRSLDHQQEQELNLYNRLSTALNDMGTAGTRAQGAQEAIAAYFAAFEGKDYETALLAAADIVNNFGFDLETIPNSKEIDIILNGADEAANQLKELDGLSQNRSVIIDVAGGSLFSRLLGSKFASGTNSAPGGPALVNELGPELISANGLAYIAGGGKPTVTMLPKGATVLTAQETRRAVGQNNAHTTLPAYKTGTYDTHTGSFDYLYDPEEEKEYHTDTGKFEEDVLGAVDWDKYEQEAAYRKSNLANYNPSRAISNFGDFLNFFSSKLRDGEFTGGNYNSGWYDATGPVPPDFKKLEEDLNDRLKNLDMQAKLAENQEDFLKAMQIYGDAQDYISQLLDLYRENGYAEDSNEVLRLANLGYDYASKQLGGYDTLQERLIEALNALTDATDDANALRERQEAVDKARETLQNAERQRTVRIFNPVTGQWEWVANASDVQKARENLQSAEEALQKEQIDQTIKAIKNAKPEDLEGMTISPAVLEQLFSGSPEQQNAFLNALNAATGGANYLGSTEAQTRFNQGTTVGQQYFLDGIQLTEEQAKGMTIHDLISMLQGLKLM